LKYLQNPLGDLFVSDNLAKHDVVGRILTALVIFIWQSCNSNYTATHLQKVSCYLPLKRQTIARLSVVKQWVFILAILKSILFIQENKNERQNKHVKS
jgi:hypothetical protein